MWPHSIQMKVHDDTLLRTQLAKEQAEQIGNTAVGHPSATIARREADHLRKWRISDRCQRLGDRLRSCLRPGYHPIPAISLSLEPANITALANDVGTEVIFLRQ